MKRFITPILWTIVLFFGLVQFSFSQNICFQTDNNNVFEGTPVAKSIAKGDFNHDGNIDIVMGNSSGASSNANDKRLEYIQNKGGRDFAPPVSFQSGSKVYDVAVGDINNDGDLDVVVANANMARIAVINGDGMGSFSTPISHVLGGSSVPTAIALGDFNGDDVLDIAVISNSQEIFIILNDDITPGTLTTHATISVPGTSPTDIVAADFNGDGDMDLAISNSGTNSVTVYHGDGAGNFSLASTTLLTPTLNAVDLVADDFNGDGKPDIAVVSEDSKQVSVIINAGGTLPATQTHIYTVGLDPSSIESADLYNNNKRDLVVINSSDNSFSILKGDGTGNFTVEPPISGTNSPNAIITGNFDADGNDDVIYSTQIEVGS